MCAAQSRMVGVALKSSTNFILELVSLDINSFLTAPPDLAAEITANTYDTGIRRLRWNSAVAKSPQRPWHKNCGSRRVLEVERRQGRKPKMKKINGRKKVKVEE